MILELDMCVKAKVLCFLVEKEGVPKIARSLASFPKFILLDEPFAGIDPIAVEEIMKMVRNLKHRGIGVIITDHNVHETLSITDRAYILIDGKIFTGGTAEELANNEEVRRLYLGESFTLRKNINLNNYF